MVSIGQNADTNEGGPSVELRTCIYCLEEKPVASFNKEHVIGQAWGRFAQSSALASTTLNCVCTECNAHFGRTFELLTARGSYEGLSRYHEGVREDVQSIRYDRVVLTLERPPEHAGILLRLLPGQPFGLPMAGLLPQLCFRASGQSRWTSVAVVELERSEHPEKLLPPFLAEGKAACMALTDNASDETRAKALMLKLVPTFSETGDGVFGPEFGAELIVKTAAIYDSNIRRTIAKFAFNMLAAHMGATFVLSSDFDPIRNFVRFDQGDGRAFVRPSEAPILGDETQNFRKYSGHFVVVEWSPGTGGIRGRVSLFNENTYVVELASPYRGLFRTDLPHGVRFDPETGTAEALGRSESVRFATLGETWLALKRMGLPSPDNETWPR